MILVDIRYGEKHVSAAFNRARSGLHEHGVYHGFVLTAGGGMAVTVWAGVAPELPDSTAFAEVGGYGVVVTQQGQDQVMIPGPGTYLIVIEVIYLPDQQTTVALKPVQTADPKHVVLGTVTVPAGATAITPDMITETGRQIGNPALLITDLTTTVITLQAQQLLLNTRLTNLEHWARSNGYNSNQIYGTSK